MKWSFKIFSAFGIGVYVHATFLLLLGVVAAGAWQSDPRDLLAPGIVLAILLIMFGCVLLHEFGHALVARRFGIRTRDITLLPIGGLARLERIPADPRQELLIAVAGPAVNLAIAGALAPLGILLGSPIEFFPSSLTASGDAIVGRLISINLLLAAFNFVPAFPMDGGRVLRALLAFKLSHVQATRAAVGVGQALAVAFGLFGLLHGDFLLSFIALFVFVAAAQEGTSAEFRYSLQGHSTSSAMITSFSVLREEDPLETAVERLLVGSQIDFPVMRGEDVAGILTRGLLIDSLRKLGPQVTLSNIPLRQVRALEDDLPLDRAYDELQAQGLRCLPVRRAGRLVGLITLDHLMEFARVQWARRGGDARAKATAA